MKSKKNSTPPQTFESPHQQAILTARWDRAFNYLGQLERPKPPTPEMVEKAQFKDKTFRWNGR